MIEGNLLKQEKFANLNKLKWREGVMMSGPITINLDASSLSTAGCLLNLKRLVIDGYTEVGVNGIMNYGVSCHKFWQIMYLTKGYYPTATQAAIESFNIPNKFLKDNRQQHMLDQRHMLSTAMGCWEMWIKQDKEFDEKEANKLLGYSGEIVRTEEAVGDPEFAKLVKEKNALIAEMEKQIAELKENLATAKVEAKKLKKPRS